jgi:hypothetical protein
MHHSILTRACLELNRVEDARVWADEVALTFGMEKENALGMWSRWLQAMVLLRSGDLRRAHEPLAPLLEALEFPLGPLDWSGWLGQTLAELALLEQKPDAGIELCDRLIHRFEEQEQLGFAAPMYYWRARLHLSLGNMQQAEHDGLRANELLSLAENRILLWRAETLLAEIYATQARETESVVMNERAKATIQYIVEHTP